jgi:oxaloacetate decarboxylase alpha subunit
MWGGATFDSAMRFFARRPLERLRVLRNASPKPSSRCCCVGQNILGYRHYADDIVDKFVSALHQERHGYFPHF